MCAHIAACGVLFWTNVALGDNGVAIDIVGTLRVRAEHSQNGDLVTVRGIVEDELGRPIADADIECADIPSMSCDSESVRVTSNQAGQFCLTARSVKQNIALGVSHPGYDRLDLLLSPSEAMGSTEIVYAPRTIDLDSDRQESLLIRYPKGPVQDLELVVSSPAGLHSVLDVRTEPSGQSELSVAPNSLPVLGRFAWIIRYGAQQSEPWPALARAVVQVGLLSREERRAEVELTLKLGAHGHLVASGRVEADSRGTLVSAEVQAGRASLLLPRSDQLNNITIHYVPLAPEYLAGPPLRVSVPAREPLLPGWLIHIWLILAFLVWFAKRWAFHRSPGTGPLLDRPLEGFEKNAHARLIHGIAGVVRDAHTGEPIPSAVVSVVRLSVSGDEPMLAASTDGSGTFSLAWPPHREGAHVLTVEKTGYRTLRGPAEGAELNIRVAERRRALLTDLVRWARRADSPWTLTRAPTPLEVAEMARKQGLNDISEWALRIHREAFGPEVGSNRTLRVREAFAPKPAAEPGVEPNSSR
jgi:hypothetical protein